MPPFPIPLYGTNSRGYLTLMGQYASVAAYRHTYILTYHTTETRYPGEGENTLDDPPWKKNLSDFTSVPNDEISILLYIPIHENETITVYGEMRHVADSGIDLVKIAEHSTTTFQVTEPVGNNPSDDVHSTTSDHVWCHAKIVFKAIAGGDNLKEYLQLKGPNQFYLFRLSMKIEEPGKADRYREENGFLLLVADT